MTHSPDQDGRGVAVVTGGSAGLGRAIAVELAQRGWHVAVLARGRRALDSTVREIEDAGALGLGLSVDVADAEALEDAASQIERSLGPIGVWVNNTMATVFGEFSDVHAAEFERATAVTYLGTVNGTRAALRHMTPRDRGHVVQIGSALAYRGIPLQSAYCGAKQAIIGFTESVLAELAHSESRVQISMVHQPALNTPQFSWARNRLPRHPQPVPPIYQPEVGARAVADVIDRPRRTTWVGAPTILTVLGNRFAPAWLDRYLGKTGYGSQQTDQMPPPHGDGNLFQAVPTDPGAQGMFHQKAHAHSPQTWLNNHRRLVAATLAAAGTVAVARISRHR